MHFIDFKKEHFNHNEKTESYFIQISKEEIGSFDIEVLEKQNDETYSKTDCEILDEVNKITIKMKNPQDIRVKF
ncbi:hypothetical protein ODZ84_22845 [Chryseobacterium fluminis]|uniref:hypothetical protein n=1 Tax=Chryseobacterium fluminis TaxID=2983606 RepID=UPI00225820F1|nr:hypothetical protein [Chryseobacterium sp. MMS21-Ot14]UZT97968.1 hypothetical protein ODZ84_22845 [Chryseobacterium sp. MMS21-Ot14]